jgi:M6 family metalloprotease-like protein
MNHISRFGLVLSICLIVLFAVPQTAWAVKANPKPVTRHQPDGTAIEVRMIGDERVVFSETLEGWTVVRDAKGWWVYADPASHGAKGLSPSAMKVGKDNVPPGWRKHVRPKIDPKQFRIPFEQKDDGSVGELFRKNMGNRRAKGAVPEAANPAPTNIPVLIILVEFSDWKHTNGVGTPVAGEPDYQPIPGQPNNGATWESVMGDRTVPGGLNHYYWEDSYQRFQWDVKVAKNGEGSGTIVNDGWYTNPQTMKYWGEDRGNCTTDGAHNIKDLIEWAIAAANPDVDYALYDTNNNGTIEDAELMIFVVHAREGQENYGSGCSTGAGDPEDPNNDHIWSHKWNIDTAVSVDGKTVPNGKVYAIEPEFSPVFDYSTNPWTLLEKYFGVGVYAHEAFHTLGATDIYDTGYDAVPAGAWDLMDSGSYNGAKSGTHPAHIGAALKQDI